MPKITNEISSFHLWGHFFFTLGPFVKATAEAVIDYKDLGKLGRVTLEIAPAFCSESFSQVSTLS